MKEADFKRFFQKLSGIHFLHILPRNSEPREPSPVSKRVILLQYLDLQIIEIDGFHKIILMEPGLGMAFKFSDIRIQPDRRAQIKIHTEGIQGAEHLLRPAHLRIIIADRTVCQKPIFLK